MQYVYEDWLLDVVRSDSAFLKSVGIEPCVIDDPCPEPLPLPYPEKPRVRLTEKDAQWLRACGVAWEPEPAVQLLLDFCGNHEDVREACPFAEVRMKKECSSCNGTGKCPQCKGTGRLGYPGYGQVDTYRTPCIACQESGVCRVCRGTGQR
jgi:hypothetical protein